MRVPGAALVTSSEASRLAAAGALLALAFPPLPFGLVALVALTPLLQVLDEDPRPGFRRGFTRGALFGSVFYLLLLFWLWDLVRFTPLIVPTWLLSSLYLGGLVGLAVGAAQWIRARTGRSPALVLPFAWVALEKALQYGDLRFTWGVLADAITPYPLLLQTAELWGALGISLVVVAVNGLVYELWKRRADRRARRAPALGLAAVAGLVVAYGAARWTALPSPGEGAGRLVATAGLASDGGTRASGDRRASPAPTPSTLPEDRRARQAREATGAGTVPPPEHVRIAVVQPDIPQEVRNRSDSDALQRGRLLELSSDALAYEPDLVVWPETAARWLRLDDAALQAIRTLCCGGPGPGVPFLVGALDVDGPFTPRQRIYNAAFVVDADGRIAATYRKALLVPMTEQVPYAGVLGLLKPEQWSGSFSAGVAFATLPFRARAPGFEGVVEVGAPICYEIIFPGPIREFRRNGARLLVTITNDAWFGRTPAPYQHFSQLRLRAVEARMPIARAANTGISGFVTARGDVVARTDIFEPALLVADLPLAGSPTPYVRWGDWIVPAAWAGLALVLAAGRARDLRTAARVRAGDGRGGRTRPAGRGGEVRRQVGAGR